MSDEKEDYPPGVPKDLFEFLVSAHGAENVKPISFLKNLKPSSIGASNGGLKIGEYYKGEGVYVGVWKPRSRMRTYLGKVFNLFAAKEDLSIIATYYDVVDKVKKITADDADYEGHAGAQFNLDDCLHEAIKNETYNGEWFIPSFDILSSQGIEQEITMEKGSLYHFRKKGKLRGCFQANNASSYFSDEAYWTCSPLVPSGDDFFTGVGFEKGTINTFSQNSKLFTRLVRAVEIFQP